jgi:cysteine desulfurase
MTIYLDYNANTPLLPAVVDGMLPFLREHFGNPSSSHDYGRPARDAVERARAQVADLLGCATEDVIFTSGGTEANNLAIRGAAEGSARRRVVTSSIEHPATSEPCRYLAEHGWRVDLLGVDQAGRVDATELRRRLDDETALVTVMHANNETGMIQPIAELAAAAHERGAIVHTDAAQSVGKVPVRVNELGVDLLSVAGHKVNAPKGVGALYVRPGTRVLPFARGAGHERGLRPGTENVASIVGLGIACALASERLVTSTYATRTLRDRLWDRLRESVPGLRLHGQETERLPNTLNVGFPDVLGSSVLGSTPEVAASTGSACHAGGETASSAILAMGIDPVEALGAVRLSVGVTTTTHDVDAAAGALVRGWRAAREKR